MSSVFLNNLDDYIVPSQECIVVSSKPEGVNDTMQAESGSERRIALTVENDPELFVPRSGIIKSAPVSIPSSSSKKATVSLNDCLACSGCVTSAETVLIQEQSTSKLTNKLKSLKTAVTDLEDPGKPRELIVVTLSPNSVASMANRLSIEVVKCFQLLSTWLKSLGVYMVCDAAVGGDIALIETREEFIKKFQNHRNNLTKETKETKEETVTSTPSVSKSATRVVGIKRNPNWFQPPTTSAYSSTRYLPVSSQTPTPYSEPIQMTSPLLPVLTSNCPGWICFAEKKHSEALKYISSTKSPQQIIGSVLKNIVYSDDSSTVFHVSVQPCFDKKLEASRLDFYHESSNSKEVDLVLSTTEFMDFLFESSVIASDRRNTSLDGTEKNDASDGKIVLSFLEDISHQALCKDSRSSSEFESLFQSASEDGEAFCSSVEINGGSGGYVEYIFRYAANKLFDIDLRGKSLDYKPGRNPDMHELELQIDGNVVMRFAKAYGFRNIQGIISNLKKDKCNLDFVEIMACPSGCNAGGGQIKDNLHESPNETRARTGQVETAFHKQMRLREPDDSPLSKHLYQDCIIGSPNSLRALEQLHTRYHAVPALELVAPLAAKW